MKLFDRNEIVFYKQLPKVDILPKLEINYINYGTNAKSNFYSTLTVLQSILKIINDIKIKNLYKEILNNILEYSGNESKLKANSSISYLNNCPSEFDVAKRGGLGNGSDIYNYSSIYMSNISMKYVKYFLRNKFTNKTVIKFPTCNSSISYQYLYLVSYIYNSVVIMKTTNDTPFRDTFYVVCDGLISDNYEILKKRISKINIDENEPLTLLYRETDIHDEFNKIINGFFRELINLVSSYLFSLKEIIELSLERNERKVDGTKQKYEYFDRISKGENFINNKKFENTLLLTN